MNGGLVDGRMGIWMDGCVWEGGMIDGWMSELYNWRTQTDDNTDGQTSVCALVKNNIGQCVCTDEPAVIWPNGSNSFFYLILPMRWTSSSLHKRGAGRSSEVERSLMVRWVVGSILHGVDPLSYFSYQPVLHDWCNKGRGMCYPVCGMVHIKEPLLLIDKSSLCGGSGFPFSLSEWSLTICLTPYNRR